MQIDVAQVASAVVPYAAAMVAAYGKATVAKTHDMAIERASNSTAELGQRIVSRILERKESSDAIEAALIDLVNEEEDAEAAFRLQVRKALAADPKLANEVASMLPPSLQASGPRSIAVENNQGVANTGDSAFIVGSQRNDGSGIFVGRDFRVGGDGDSVRG